MLNSILKLGAVTLLAAAFAAAPAQLLAQTTNKPAAEKQIAPAKKASAEKKPAVAGKEAAEKKTAVAKKDPAAKPKSAHPFHGKLAEVNKVAKTILCGKSVYQITAETKIMKDGKPATLEDGVVGEPVSGYVIPAEDGKMAAKTVRFGQKSEEKGGEKKKKAQ